MDGDPQMPENFIDWGMQPDGARLMPSFQEADAEPHERCFGIQREEPCGCEKLSTRIRAKKKVDVETRAVLEWQFWWDVNTLHWCEQHHHTPPVEESAD